MGWSLAVVMTIVAGAAFWNVRQRPAPTEQALGRFTHVLPDSMTMARVGSYGPALALSRSGTKLAYVAHDGGETKLYVRRVDEFEAHEVAGTERAWSPFFSPDERWIGFFADNQLKKVPLDGGASQKIAEVSSGGASLAGATWGPDNTIIFAEMFSRGLWRVSGEGGVPERIADGSNFEAEHAEMIPLWPDMLPDGKTVLFTVGSGTGLSAGLAVLSLETGEDRLVTEGGGNGRYVSSGHIVYALGGDLLAQPFDLDELSVTGAPVPVVNGVMTGGEGTGHFAVAWNGTLAYVPGRLAGPARELEWVDMRGNRERIPLDPGEYLGARISPDGRYLAYSVQGPPFAAWVYDLSRGASQRITGERVDGGYPLWTPDGRRLVIHSNGDGGQFLDLAWIPADGSGPEERILDWPNIQYPQSWADSGRTLIFSETGDAVNQGDVWMVETEGEREPRPLLNTASNEVLPSVSPDGRWLAFVSDDAGRQDVLVQPFLGTGARMPVSTRGGTGPLWAPDGKELYYRDVSGDTVFAVTFEGDPTVQLGNPRVLFTGNYVPDYPFSRGYDLAPRGDRFLMTLGTPPIQGWTKINIVLGWAESLQETVDIAATNR
jgi:serine/threonine-protein kinase